MKVAQQIRKIFRKKRLGLDGLPPELRIMIFEYCDLSWRPRASESPYSRQSLMPPLIVALHPWKRPYEEALELFYQQNTYELCFDNSYNFGLMLPSAISTIRHINIAYQ
jgi:hypothetical protein